MKKIVSMLMALVLLLSCGAFAAAESENGILGQWYLSEIRLASGNVISPYDLMELTTLTINENGSASFEMNTYFRSGTIEGVWSENGDAYTMINVDSHTVNDMTLEVVDGVERLVIAGESRTDVYTREAPEGEEMHTVPYAADVTAADFDGVWGGVAYLLYEDQLFFNTDTMMDITLYYDIQNTYVTSFAISHETGERQDFYTGDNGDFSTTDGVGTILTSAYEYIGLREDGTLLVSVNDGKEMLICRKLTDEEIAALPEPVVEE